MPSLIYSSFIRDVLVGNIDMDTDTFRVMLTTSAYTENKDTHTRRSDVTNEVTGTGYTAGGVVSTSTVATVDTANDRVDVTIGAGSWTTSTITARKAVIYKARGAQASADELVAVVDFTTDAVSSAGTFTLTASTVRFQN